MVSGEIRTADLRIKILKQNQPTKHSSKISKISCT